MIAEQGAGQGPAPQASGTPERFALATALTHAEARALWGEPDECEGSVNDPRTREEHGICFNERWIYRLPRGERRIVYWHRYDCRGVLRVAADGEVRPELP